MLLWLDGNRLDRTLVGCFPAGVGNFVRDRVDLHYRQVVVELEHLRAYLFTFAAADASIRVHFGFHGVFPKFGVNDCRAPRRVALYGEL